MKSSFPAKLTFASLVSATSLIALSTPARAQDECGVQAPEPGTVTCTPAGNDYPDGIFYIAPDDLTIVLQDGVNIDTTGGLNPGILAIAGSLDAAVTVSGATNTTITTDASGGFGALVATNNGALTVNLDDISTTGANASGIVASSSEGVVTVSANSISTTGDSAAGIDANTNISDIFIDSGIITTAGLAANGIMARSDFADLNIVSDSIATTGGPLGFFNPGASGIVATTSGLGAIAIDSGTISTSGDSAAGIRASNNTGAVSIISDSVTTAGAAADGITVTSRGGVDVTGGTVATSGAGSNGIQVQSTVGATIDFTSVTTSGANSVGILVPQGALFFGPLVTPTATVTGGSVSTTGAASNAVDISTTTGPIDLDLGPVSATGLGSVGIKTASTSGGQTITVDGVTANADAIRATSSGGGNIVVNANNDVTSTTGIGINVATDGTAMINVAADAPVTGQTVGINSVAAGGTVVNLGASVVGTTGFAINLDGGASTINNLATSTLTGAINLTDAADVFNNSGTTTLTGTSDFGLGTDALNNQAGATLNLTQAATVNGLEALNNSGLINATGTTMLTGTTFNNLAAGTISADGAASLAGLAATNNSGAIDLQDGDANDQLTLAGDFIGSGGSNLLIDFNNTTADRLIINGAASGTTTINANYLGTGLINIGGVLVVDTVSSSANAFTLGSIGGNTSPLVSYSLIQNGADYFLTAAPTAAAFDPLAISTMAGSLWYQSADEVIAQTDLPSASTGIGVWGQGYYSQDKYGDGNSVAVLDGATFAVDNRLKTRRLGAQAGIDYGFGGARVGITGGYGQAKADNDLNSKLKARGWNIGAYGQFGGETGIHGSALAKYDRYKLDFDSGAFDGEGSRLGAMGVDGSIGYRFGFGSSAMLDAKVGLAHVRTKIDDISAFGFNYDLGRTTSTRGRAGMRATFGGDLAPYVDATVYREFNGDGTVRLFDGLTSTDFDSNGKGTWARLEAGLAPQLGAGPIVAAWADLGDKKGFGVRAGFRFGGRTAGAVMPPPPPPQMAAPPPPPATQTCGDGSVILATDMCPMAPPPPPPPAPEPERG